MAFERHQFAVDAERIVGVLQGQCALVGRHGIVAVAMGHEQLWVIRIVSVDAVHRVVELDFDVGAPEIDHALHVVGFVQVGRGQGGVVIKGDFITEIACIADAQRDGRDRAC